MSSIARIIDKGRTYFLWAVEWQRKFRCRNGTDDARRARASRLLMQQSFGGLLIGGFPSGEVSASERSQIPTGGHER